MTKKQILIVGIMTALSVAGFLTSATPAFAQVTPTVTLDSIAPQTVTIGDVLSFTVHATDSDPSGIVTYSMLQEVGFLSSPVIDPTTGVFRWDTGLSGNGCNTYNFFIAATGSTGGLDSEVVSVTVNPIPGALCLPYVLGYVGTSTVTTTFIRTTVVAGTTSNGGLMTMVIPSGTNITGPVGWNGILYLPAATTTTDANAVSSVFMGFGDMLLTFDRGVRLDFIGQAGNSISYTHGADTPTEIMNLCSADTQAGDALPSGGDCKIDAGSDLVVWTKHFSTFTTRKSVIEVQASIVPKDEIVLNSNATVQVAVFGSSDFDAATIDPERTTFAGAPINHALKNHPLISYRDVNRDGMTDAVLHFKTNELHLNAVDTSAMLDGYTTTGVHFRAIVTVEK